MKLLPDARDSWAWMSTWAFAAIAAIPPAWAALPEDVKAMIPDGWTPYIVSVLAIAGYIGRITDQGRRG